MNDEWPSIQGVHTTFENSYSNPELIKEIMPELGTLVNDHVRLCAQLENLHGPLVMADAIRLLCEVEEELQTHFTAEEEVVFPKLAKYLGGMEFGPVGIMMKEHRQIRDLYAQTATALEATTREAKRLSENLTSLATALLNHLGKEDTGIFLMAGAQLNDDEKAAIKTELAKWQK